MFLIFSNRKPATCAAIVEYASHEPHRSDRDDTSEENEEVKVVIVDNRPEGKPYPDTRECSEDYDTLWSVNRNRLQFDNRTDTTNVYSHMIRNDNACVGSDENPYDRAELSTCDRRTISALYERVHMSGE